MKVLREGGKAFLSLYDLEKAFDTIEKAVLLQCLHNKGICGRALRIINSWYTGATAAIEIENTVSELFQQERGVRQGLVLSPTQFLMVMDEMLKENGAGVSIAGLYLGSAAHADDIRSLSQTISATERQAATGLVNFSTNNGLQINACETEVVALSMTNHAPNFTFSVAGH